MRAMTFRAFLIFMTVATIMAWAGWIVVLIAIDPTKAGVLAFVFFYLTLSLSLIGTLTMGGTGVRYLAKREEILSRHVSKSFRQAFLFTILVDGSLMLMSRGLFRWWTAMLLILFLAVVELAFLTAQKPRIS
jgi:hypothetical protein